MSSKTKPNKTLARRKRAFQEISDATNDEPVATSSSNEDITARKLASLADKTNGDVLKTPDYIVGLDFGTTNTSVSYYKFKAGRRSVKVPSTDIKSIRYWPYSGRNQNSAVVPSESCYVDGQYFWGYKARQKLKELHSSEEGLDESNSLIRFSKLLLFDDRLDFGARHELQKILKKLGKSVQEVIKDYLVEIFRHTKSQLIQLEDFRDTGEVELSLSVPAGWPLEASWALQEILKDVTQRIVFGQGFNLFILHEPEAASAFSLDMLLGPKRISVRTLLISPLLGRINGINMKQKGEAFIVCDAGGGTVDVITYKVDRKSPFRLVEVVIPAGANCGSTYINQAMERDLSERLKDEEYLVDKKISKQYQMRHILFPEFEDKIKRDFDMSTGLDGVEHLDFPGLEANAEKEFLDGKIVISRRRLAGYFKRSLQGTAKLIREQLDAAEKKNYVIQKILLVGGFALSPTLRYFLGKEFSHLNLIFPNDVEIDTVVSRGTVYRAIDKSNGPARQIIANFGLLQLEEYSPKCAPHRDANPRFNGHDRRRYVDDCVNWIIKKGRVVAWNESFIEKHYQVFGIDEPWEIRQRLYYSVTDNVEDHYQLGHPINAGHKLAGRLVVDLSRLKNENFIKPKRRQGGKPFYEIHYDLLMEVQGRNLKITLLYPPGQEAQGHTQICIAASFQPGTE